MKNYIKYLKGVPAITASNNTGYVFFTCHFQIQIFKNTFLGNWLPSSLPEEVIVYMPVAVCVSVCVCVCVLVILV